ncbi:MAG: ribosome silencing factor [Acidobacteriota bacterium]
MTLTLASIGTELRAAIEASQEKKASDLVLLDLRGLASFTDFFFLCSGNSERQLKAIADAVEEKLGKLQVRPNHVEGYLHGEWILMDYVDFIVHIFGPRSRSHFDLERLWGSAGRLAIAS